MISKEEYRKFLLKQIAEDENRRKMEKEERMGIIRVPLPNQKSNIQNIQAKRQQTSTALLNKASSLDHKRSYKSKHLGVTKQLDLKIVSSSAYQTQDNTPQLIQYKEDLDKQQKHSEISSTQKTSSNPSSNFSIGRGRNLLAMENMDHTKEQINHKKKLQMQKFLLQQIKEQKNNRILQKKKRIDEEKKIQQQVDKHILPQNSRAQRKFGKKMVTLQSFFPDSNKNNLAMKDQSQKIRIPQKRAYSEQKNLYQISQMNRVKSLKTFDNTPKTINITNNLPENHQNEQSKIQQVNQQYYKQINEQVSSPKSYRSKSYRSRSNNNLQNNNIQVGDSEFRKTRRSYYTQSNQPQSQQQESETETVKEQKYQQIAWQLKKIRKQIMAQRQLMAIGIVKAELETEKKNLNQLKKQASPNKNHIRPHRKYKFTKNQNFEKDEVQLQKYGSNRNFMQESQLLCESKKVPIMSSEGASALTMSKIDDFALGQMSIRRQMQEPSFVSRNEFLDPSRKNNLRDNILGGSLQPIQEYMFRTSNCKRDEQRSSISHQSSFSQGRNAY